MNTTNIINGMRPIHPGAVWREEFLQTMDMTAHALAMALQVPAPRINDVVRERRAVTPCAWPNILVPAQSSGWACKPTLIWPRRAQRWAMCWRAL